MLLDLTHTSHTSARTGIQRLTRALYTHLGDRATPVTRDPFLGVWRALEPWEHATLARGEAGAKRSASWPRAAKWRGRWRRATGQAARRAIRDDPDGVIVPEFFSPRVAADLPRLFAATTGPRIAVFCDAIALKLPELTPPGTVARYPGYLRELLQFDGVAAISEDSRDTLLEYWQWLGARDVPRVEAIPLAIDDQPPAPLAAGSAGAPPAADAARAVVLTVGSLEGRKNHLALFDACEQLWSRGLDFELHVVGFAQAQTGHRALTRLRELQAAGRPLRYDGAVSDAAIARAYAACAFTVYPSLMEGFGLPVLESLARGKPCICSAQGALGESARDGGCLALPRVDIPSLATAIAALLEDPARRAALSAAARRRTFRSWRNYADDLAAWLRVLSRRPDLT